MEKAVGRLRESHLMGEGFARVRRGAPSAALNKGANCQPSVDVPAMIADALT